jgi:hypothetical protein
MEIRLMILNIVGHVFIGNVVPTTKMKDRIDRRDEF